MFPFSFFNVAIKFCIPYMSYIYDFNYTVII